MQPSTLSNRHLYDHLKCKSTAITSESASEILCLFVSQHYHSTITSQVKCSVITYVTHLRGRWVDAGRYCKRFEAQNISWLDNKFELVGYPEVPEPCLPSTSAGGRPKANFEEASERTKRRRNCELHEMYSANELLNAAIYALKQEGRREEALSITAALS